MKKVKKIYQAALYYVLLAPALSLAQLNAGGFGTGFNTNGQTLGQIATNINSSLVGIKDLVEGFSYVAALIFLILGIIKFKAHRDDPRHTPLSTPMVIWICAGLFAFAPTLISSFGVTLWGQGGATSVMAPR